VRKTTVKHCVTGQKFVDIFLLSCASRNIIMICIYINGRYLRQLASVSVMDLWSTFTLQHKILLCFFSSKVIALHVRMPYTLGMKYRRIGKHTLRVEKSCPTSVP